MYIDQEQKPTVLSGTNFVIALILHALMFGVLWSVNQLRFREKEIVIPIDLTVVMHENLNGNENEPPPVKPPEPKPPEPKPEPPKPEPPKPKPPEPVKPPEAVEQIHEKTNVVKKVEEPKKPEEPKKTAAELRAERIKRMQEMAKDVKDRPKPPPEPVRNGKTGRKTLSDAEIARLMAMGYKAGATEQIAPNEESMCLGFLKRAIDATCRRSPA